MVGIPRQGHSLREGFGRQLASASCRGEREDPLGTSQSPFLGLPAPRGKVSARDQPQPQTGLPPTSALPGKVYDTSASWDSLFLFTHFTRF